MATWRPGSPSSSERSRTERFSLDGPSRHPDPRVNAYRADIADVRLAGVLFAPHYARAQHGSVTAPSAMLRAAPDAKARAVSQLAQGEGFETLDIAGGWAWGRCLHDDYVGYLRADALGAPIEASHRISALAAPVFADADIKAPVAATLPIGTLLTATAEGDFLKTGEGFVHARHAVPIADKVDDPVAVAERLIGQPYLWGGRGAEGIDCSGLVQLALAFAGIAAPRDSDMQRDRLGDAIPREARLRRGDLIFFPGHIGMMVDADRLIHANAFWMAVTVEPLAEVIERLVPAYPEPVLARKRLATIR